MQKSKCSHKKISDQEASSKPREKTDEFLHGVVPAEEEEDHRSQSRLP